MRTSRAAFLLLTLGLPVAAAPASAEGKYTRRLRQRGEVTDTAPKLDRYAYIDDSAPKPRELVLVVDTWNARRQRDPKLLPLVAALSFEGTGPPLRITPGRFALAWETEPGATLPLWSPAVPALSHDELTCDEREPAASPPCRGTAGPSPVAHDARLLSRRSPLPFDPPFARRSAQFYSHPSLGLRRDDVWLPAQTATSVLLYFPVPEGLDVSERLFELRYLEDEGAEPAVACRFRIQPDPALQSAAMRRAREDLRREQRRKR